MWPIPVEVLGAKGLWHKGFLLLEFLSDGTVAVRSERTDRIKHLEQGQWRDPVEEEILARSVQQEAPEGPGVSNLVDRTGAWALGGCGGQQEPTPVKPKSGMSVLELLRMK